MAAKPAAPRKLTSATKGMGRKNEGRPGLHLIILVGRRAPGRSVTGRK